jgi:hypothetical protein
LAYVGENTSNLFSPREKLTRQLHDNVGKSLNHPKKNRSSESKTKMVVVYVQVLVARFTIANDGGRDSRRKTQKINSNIFSFFLVSRDLI